MSTHKPLRADMSPKVRALIERLQKSGDKLEATVNAQTEDFKKLRKGDPLQGLMGKVLLRDREEVRATDEFSQEVKTEDELLKKEEAQWAEEDRGAGRK